MLPKLKMLPCCLSHFKAKLSNSCKQGHPSAGESALVHFTMPVAKIAEVRQKETFQQPLRRSYCHLRGPSPQDCWPQASPEHEQHTRFTCTALCSGLPRRPLSGAAPGLVCVPRKVLRHGNSWLEVLETPFCVRASFGGKNFPSHTLLEFSSCLLYVSSLPLKAVHAVTSVTSDSLWPYGL